jgi:hypothetical protein
LEQYLAGLTHWLASTLRARRTGMVEIRVAVADATGVHTLLRRLTGVFDRSSVSFDGRRKEVRVRSEPESRTVVLVLDAVEAWLAEDGAGSAKLSLGDRSYTMVGPFAITSSP